MPLPRIWHALPAQALGQLNAVGLTGKIIGAAIKIHRRLGPGLLESAYEACLAYELERVGLRVERQKAVPLVYDSVKLECGFRADLVVQGRIAVELTINAKNRYIQLTARNCCRTCGCWVCRSGCL